MSEPNIVLVGRSSSHFTRTARLFALELGIPHSFWPVLDMTSTDAATYADNPALKVPALIDEQGPLYGSENVCRALARRSGQRDRVVLRGDVEDRLVANAEELIVHAMGAEVILIMGEHGGAAPPKVRRSIENALAFLDAHVRTVVAALPSDRVIGFCEAALFSLVTHLPFRKIMDVDAYAQLRSFCADFGVRPAALATAYRFDAA